jgi:hypothetical protein
MTSKCRRETYARQRYWAIIVQNAEKCNSSPQDWKHICRTKLPHLRIYHRVVKTQRLAGLSWTREFSYQRWIIHKIGGESESTRSSNARTCEYPLASGTRHLTLPCIVRQPNPHQAFTPLSISHCRPQLSFCDTCLEKRIVSYSNETSGGLSTSPGSEC